MVRFHFIEVNNLRRINGKGGFAVCSAYLSQRAERVEENLPIKVVVYRLFSVYFPSFIITNSNSMIPCHFLSSFL